jgi:hypothetical protein
MIQPASLWSLFKTCPNSRWVGDICRKLGGQEVELDFGQQQMLTQIKLDSEWMDERIDEQKARWAQRQRDKRERDKAAAELSKVTQCHGDKRDNRDSHDVTIPPFLPSSLPPSLNTTSKDVVVVESDDINGIDEKLLYPDPDTQRLYAAQVGVPLDYIDTFNARIQEMGFQYISRSGATVNINRRNWKSVLRKFYAQDNKKPQSPTALKQDGYKAEMEMA